MLRWVDRPPLDRPAYCARRGCAQQILGRAVFTAATLAAPDGSGDLRVTLFSIRAEHVECARPFPGGGPG